MAMVLRFICLVLIVISLMLLGADVMTSLEKGEVTVRTLAQVWNLADAVSLTAFRGWLEHTLPGFLASGTEAFLDNVYSWAPFGIIGVIVAFLLSRPASYEG